MCEIVWWWQQYQFVYSSRSVFQTGPYPLQKRVFQRVRSSAFSFSFEYLLVCLKVIQWLLHGKGERPLEESVCVGFRSGAGRKILKVCVIYYGNILYLVCYLLKSGYCKLCPIKMWHSCRSWACASFSRTTVKLVLVSLFIGRLMHLIV